MEKIVTKQNEIWLDDQGILCVRAVENAEMDLEEVRSCFDGYKSLGLGKKKVLQLLDLRRGASMTSEARAFVSGCAEDFFIASAVISNSLSVRLMVNFFTLFYGKKIPLHMFGTEREARVWLQKFQKNKKQKVKK